VHAFFKVAYAFAKSAHHFRNFLSSEQEDDDRQNDQPMNWAKFSHVYLPSRVRRFDGSRLESPGVNLKYNTLVADPARQVFPVEVLEQWNRVFPGHTGKFFECANRKLGAAFLAVLGERFAQSFYSHLMEN